MGDNAFQEFVERCFTPKVQYVMTGGKTRVVVYLPPIRLRGGYYANVNLAWRMILSDIEMG